MQRPSLEPHAADSLGDDTSHGRHDGSRAELFSISQLARHARTLAGWHELSAARGDADWLLSRLDDTDAELRDAYALITEAVHRGQQITPAAEWFIDNYHLDRKSVV